MTSSVQRWLINCFCSLIIFLVISGNEIPKATKEGLPFCGLAESSSRYIFVSTLDGKLTALNPNNKGSVVWSIHPGAESMLSSSIHKLELSNYGHLVRMIPSLSGGLYKFNGENIEVIPITADHLLQSSFRYSDDLVISGGKETRTFGVSLTSGNVIYECSMKGCGNVSHSTDNGEILVIQRLGQIVRAVDPRTGTERWNFSVAQHDLKLLSECHSQHNNELNFKLKVIVPEGIICALDPKTSEVMWKQRFSSPVVSAWQLQRGKLIEVDLFDSNKVMPLNSEVPPSIYIGMHEKQLYIQESVAMLRKKQEIAFKAKQKLIGSNNYPKIPWKPVPASSTALGITFEESENAYSTDDATQRQTTALSVLYASPYVDGSGFYLHTEEELENIEKGSCNTSGTEIELFNNKDNNDDDVKIENLDVDSESDFLSEFVKDFSEANTSVEIVIVSFWYYWKEVLVISITTAFICNIMITTIYQRWSIKSLSKAASESTINKSTEKDNLGLNINTEIVSKTSDVSEMLEYTSRYLTDFEPVACLGKGGFGVVFEAKNKIDDCHYAIKRILLPSRKESRDRVMREVKALAKLDHHHIVRYFNAWTECPPSGWQEKYDKSCIKMNSDIFTSNDTLSLQPTTLQSGITEKSSFFSKQNSSSFCSSQLNSNDFSENKNDISDSYIVFDEGSENSELVKKSKNEEESVISITSDKNESLRIQSIKVLTNSDRPNSLPIDKNASLVSQNINKVYLYIQMQLCQRQSLRDWLTNHKEREYHMVLNIFEQILQAVEHVHLHGLIHRDLKPSNIFFSLDNQIKVGDFGLVTAMTEDTQIPSPVEGISVKSQNERHTAQVGTQLYMSQEQLLGKPYNYKVDIYSLGLILFELLVPFSTQMERITVLQDVKNYKYPVDFKEKYKNEHKLLQLMLSHSPDERPTTYGVRARLPLKQEFTEEAWHFELPTRRRTSSKTSSSNSSNDGSSDMQ